MFCKYCGEPLEENVPFCSRCGKSLRVPNKTVHWVPIITVIVSYFLFFLILGGDYVLEEVNFFDYLTLISSFVALVLSIVLVPKERLALRIVSIIASSLLAVSALGWITTHGF